MDRGRDEHLAVIRFAGTLVPASFAEFAAHRADRLSLARKVLAQDANGATIRVTGPAAPVDASKMALSLGLAACLVREVTRLDPEG